MTSAHERRNREFWDADADAYQEQHAEQLSHGRVWGTWGIPDDELDILGDTAGLDVLELGCGAAEWSIALRCDGARAIGLDQSSSQLRHARANVERSKVSLPLVCASGEAVPLRAESFDVVFCDHGAMSFCDPERIVPEVSRLLRPGGLLAFNKGTHLMYLTYDWEEQRQDTRLHVGYFDRRVFDTGEGSVDFQVPHGEWIRLFSAQGMYVERLHEQRAPDDGSTTYVDYVPAEWARQWPAEEIWKVRKR